MTQRRGETESRREQWTSQAAYDGYLTPPLYPWGMEINEVSGQIVDAAIKVHSVLGPGLLEAAYQVCLAYELKKRGFTVRREVRVPVRYDGMVLNIAYRIDPLVDERVIVEVKAVSNIVAVHEAQLLSQLKLGDYRLGLLINFNVPRLKEGVVRKVNRL